MVFDLVIAIIAITLLSVLAFMAGQHLGRTSHDSRPLLFAVSLIFSLTFAWSHAGRLIWADAIPLSGVILWSNFMPPLLGFTAGLARATPGLNRWHRPLTVLILACIAAAYLLMPVAQPILAPAVITSNEDWKNDICLQSHSATCGAAAAVTLLRSAGIPARETTLIDDCLTSRHGTVPLGLYRGLAIHANKYARSAQVASKHPEEWLEQNQLPNVALVRFENSAPKGSIGRLLGPRGDGHAVVVFGMTDGGRWIIGDPAFGRTYWSDEEFRERFTGDAIYLAR